MESFPVTSTRRHAHLHNNQRNEKTSDIPHKPISLATARKPDNSKCWKTGGETGAHGHRRWEGSPLSWSQEPSGSSKWNKTHSASPPLGMYPWHPLEDMLETVHHSKELRQPQWSSLGNQKQHLLGPLVWKTMYHSEQWDRCIYRSKNYYEKKNWMKQIHVCVCVCVLESVYKYIYMCIYVCVYFCCCSVTKSCLTLFDFVDCSTPGFPVLHYLLEFAQIHIHWVIVRCYLTYGIYWR